MKFWVTRYALSKGLFQVDFEEARNDGYWIEQRDGSDRMFFRKTSKDAVETLDEARAIAREMASKKIASLEKQIAKLRKLEREPKVVE